ELAGDEIADARRAEVERSRGRDDQRADLARPAVGPAVAPARRAEAAFAGGSAQTVEISRAGPRDTLAVQTFLFGGAGAVALAAASGISVLGLRPAGGG